MIALVKRFFLLSALMLFSFIIVSQNNASVREVKRTMKTYMFSDPDPVANPGSGFYPYCRFDGYAAKGADKEWNLIEMENDFIKVTVAPEIGGKVWGAVEKSTKNDFIYYNRVVKFRDISMRGPWTSGGIEFNFGLIGHVPTTATPVDYKIRENDDGSVSCFIGALELLTHTSWTVEINLPKDKACFTTRTFWRNSSGVEQPFYHWSNAAYHDGNDMEMIFPGKAYIGHGGDAHLYPYDAEKRNLSRYENNDFGDSKSRHVLGTYADFYGAYWHHKDYGSVHYVPYDEKFGKKIFIWGLSQSGMIWEKLLTDNDGQYVELQSGKTFSQPGSSSAYTPFKHPGFAPMGTEEWKEYWFPVNGTKGITKANPFGVLNVDRKTGSIFLSFCPLQKITETIRVYAGGKEIHEALLDLQVLETWNAQIEVPSDARNLRIVIGDRRLVYDEYADQTPLERPLSPAQEFDWNSTYGLYVQGEQCLNQKLEAQAETHLLKCLERDPCFLPALNKAALLYYRWGRYDTSLEYCKKALQVDTYNGETNYLYALNHLKIGKLTDAKDGFSIASFSVAEKSAAFLGLAKCFFLDGDWDKAEHYLHKSLEYNMHNLFARELFIVLCRVSGRKEQAAALIDEVLEENPLNHLVAFERFLLSGNENDLARFINGITNELPFETYLELSEWYVSLRREQEAIQLLSNAPENPLICYHLAYLYHKTGKQSDSKSCLNRAEQLSPEWIFPHRVSTLECLEWAKSEMVSWKNNYYRALLYATLGNPERALDLLNQCDDSGFAPLFIVRSKMKNGDGRLRDLLNAERLNPGDWRVGMELIIFYQRANRHKEALEYAEKYFGRDPRNYRIGLRYAKVLSDNGLYDKSLSVLSTLEVLPNEGASEGRVVYRNASLMKGIDCLKKKQYVRALGHVKTSMLWPENLGVGKPYDEDIDMHFENYLQGVIYEKMNKKKQASLYFEKVIAQTSFLQHSNIFLTALALRKSKRIAQADRLMANWKEREPDAYIQQWCDSHYHKLEKSDITQQTKVPGEEPKPWEQAGKSDGNFHLIASLQEFLCE